MGIGELLLLWLTKKWMLIRSRLLARPAETHG